jgi:hypothetical protein
MTVFSDVALLFLIQRSMWSSLVLLGVVVSICFAAPIRSVADLSEKPRFGALPDPKHTPGSALA